jgi:dTDP-4-amino-4,6-dideoxygalactose transaminase
MDKNIQRKNKLIFVNTNSGFPFTNWQQVKDYNLPIIEDRAYSLFSTDNQTTGLIGDFVIYSLPKWFPMQMGGILQSNSNILLDDERQTETERILLNILKYYPR